MRSNFGFSIKGYVYYGRNREGKIGGGVGILVRSDIAAKVTPHINDRGIEIMWVSVYRKNCCPLLVGVYYGRQETRTSQIEIQQEMLLLQEEITEMSNEGEILLAMDGNAKIGLLGEDISRNGSLLLETIEQTGLVLMNGTEKCRGKVTRFNTKNDREKSAIDFVLANEEVAKWINEINIDEDGMIRVRGKNETDHNTITMNLDIDNLDNVKKVKRTTWNLRTSTEKWTEFENELQNRMDTATTLINEDRSMEECYKGWYNEIDKAERKTIGKTTYKENGKQIFSDQTKKLREKKKEMKTKIRCEHTKEAKDILITNYKALQEEISAQITSEKTSMIQAKLERIVTDKSKNNVERKEKDNARFNTGGTYNQG